MNIHEKIVNKIKLQKLTLASCMNLEITTGWSLLMAAADPRYDLKSLSQYATFIAAPLSTYDGRTRQGYPTFWQNANASYKASTKGNKCRAKVLKEATGGVQMAKDASSFVD